MGFNLLRELVATAPGKMGVALLVLLLALSIYVVVSFPLNFGESRWGNPAQWSNNPKAVPPAWSDLFSGKDHVRHKTTIVTEPEVLVRSNAYESRTYSMPFEFNQDEPPTFAIASVSSVSYYGRPPLLIASIARPDNSEIVLFREVVRGPRDGESQPIHRFFEDPLRIALTTEPHTATKVSDFFRDTYGANIHPDELQSSLSRSLVSIPDPSNPKDLRLLPGRYELRLRAAFSDHRDSIESITFVLGGSVFGLMGTDNLGRDLALGLAFGLPVALFIGVMASILTTVIGTSLGIASGYMGGKTDLVIQRFADIVANVPLLPLLIFMVFVFGSNLFLIILFLVAFSWPGLTILIRSMVLQIRSGALIESAVALGASKWRVMLRHVFPHTAPFVFAQMIFFAPAAILAEAGLSFLGLGDPSIPTWGQILQNGFQTGAVYVGYWWWVIPPGLLIILTAVTFMLLSLGMEPAVNPRLRRAR